MRIRIEPPRFVLECRYEERETAKALGFLWDPSRRQWWTSSCHTASQADPSATDLINPHPFTQPLVAGWLNGPIPVPKGKELLLFQSEAVRTMVSYKDRNWLLADEMGLGKTIEALVYCNALRPKRVLIICPAGLILNWRREANQWLTYLPELVIESYASPRLEAHALESWSMLICDEAHYLKNPNSQRSQRVLGHYDRVRKTWRGGIEADRKLFLTGTPIMNHPIELYPLIRYLDPQEWHNPWHFKQRYCAPYQTQYGWRYGTSNLGELGDRLRSTILIRRTKAEVLPFLPKKRRQLIVLETSGRVRKLVELENKLAKKLGPKLMQAPVGMDWAVLSRIRHKLADAKLKPAIEHIDSILESGQKLVVFAHHLSLLHGLGAHYPEAALIDGAIPLKARQQRVDEFQSDPKCRLFLGQLETTGLGYTLTAASNVLFVELDWVPAKLTQAEDRCHRVGQTQSVLVQHLVFEGSLDERMLDTIISKQGFAEKVLDNHNHRE